MKKTFILLISFVLISTFVIIAIKAQNTTQNKQQAISLNTNQNTMKNNNGNDRMKDAYDVSGYMVKDRLSAENKENEKIIEDISKNDLIVIDGTYDHIHLVLDALKLPFTRISQSDVSRVKLEPHQTVFINCAGNFPSDQLPKIAEFVRNGGQLITTDWAIKSVLEPGFPGYVAFNGKPTRDEVVQVQVIDKDDSVIKGFLDEETDPVWWLEGSSYPIKILNNNAVNVLIKSDELKRSYGEEAVLIRFNHGKGVVYHMISHFYLQRTETKSDAQKGNVNAYMSSKNISSSVMEDKEVSKKSENLNYGDVQSANTSSEFLMRAVIKQKEKNTKK